MKKVCIDMTEIMNSEKIGHLDMVKMKIICDYVGKGELIGFEYKNNVFQRIKSKIISDFFLLGEVTKKESYYTEEIIKLEDIDNEDNILLIFNENTLSESEYKKLFNNCFNVEKVLFDFVTDKECINFNDNFYDRVFCYDKEKLKLNPQKYYDLNNYKFQIFQDSEDELIEIDKGVQRFIEKKDKFSVVIANYKYYRQVNNLVRYAIKESAGQHLCIIDDVKSPQAFIEKFNEDEVTVFYGLDYYSIKKLLIKAEKTYLLPQHQYLQLI